MKKILLLVDGHAIIYRSYYAFKHLSTPQGQLVNAVYGFTRVVLTAIRNLEPTHIAVVFDHPRPTFRHEQYADYKAHRAEMPDDLKPQVEMIKNVVKTLNIPQFEVPGFEADDLIGALCFQANTLVKSGQADLDVIIATGDTDLFQLVDEVVKVWLPARGKEIESKVYAESDVKAKSGVTPEQIVDLKALMGDSSDNIPGVKGIGPKTAVSLISEFGSVEKLYEAVESLSVDTHHPILKGAVLKKLQTHREEAFLSQSLARIDRQAPIKLELADCLVTGYDKEQAAQLFEELSFKSLVPLLPNDEFESGVQDALF